MAIKHGPLTLQQTQAVAGRIAKQRRMFFQGVAAQGAPKQGPLTFAQTHARATRGIKVSMGGLPPASGSPPKSTGVKGTSILAGRSPNAFRNAQKAASRKSAPKWSARSATSSLTKFVSSRAPKRGAVKSFLARGNVPVTAKRPKAARSLFGTRTATSARASFKGNYTNHKFNRSLAKQYSTKGMSIGQRAFVGALRGIEHLSRGGKAPKGYAPPALPSAPKAMSAVSVPKAAAPKKKSLNQASGGRYSMTWNGSIIDHHAKMTPMVTGGTTSFADTAANFSQQRGYAQGTHEDEFRGYARKAAETRKRKKDAKHAKSLKVAERRAAKAKPKALTITQKVKVQQKKQSASMARASGQRTKALAKAAPKKKAGASIQSRVASKKKTTSAKKPAARKTVGGGNRKTAGSSKKRGDSRSYYMRLDPRTGKKIKVGKVKKGHGKSRKRKK